MFVYLSFKRGGFVETLLTSFEKLRSVQKSKLGFLIGQFRKEIEIADRKIVHTRLLFEIKIL